MNKKTTIIKQNNPYEISVIIDNTALIHSLDGKSGLINIKNNQIIGSLKNYNTIYNPEQKIYIQQSSDENTSVEQKYKKIRIYDAECEKLIIDNCKLTNVLYKNIYVYFDKSQYHIFDLVYYRDNNSSIDETYDGIEEFSNTFYGKYLLVTKNEKTGIYQMGKGLIVPCIYDKITQNDCIVIFHKDDKQFFSYVAKILNISPGYDSITVDKCNNRIYCKNESTIYIYNTTTEKITNFCCDNITYINSNYKDGMYIYKKDNKYGIVNIGSEDNKISNKNKILLNNEYDEIIYKGSGIFYLKKDNKYGIYNCINNIVIEPKYDNIKPTNFYYVYLLYSGEFFDIVNVEKNKTLVDKCEFIENYSKEIIYSKDNYFGLITYDGDFKIIEKYDKIEYLDDNLFLLQKENNKGVCKKGNIIIPIKYQEIEQISHKSSSFSKCTYFKLKCSDNYCKLATIKEYSYLESDVKYDDKYCGDIQLLPDVLVFKDNNYTYIFNYSSKLLSAINGCVDVSLVKTGDKRLYFIDGVYYVYKDDKFVMLPSEICDLYQTVYESVNGNVIVSSFDKKEHDYVCNEIEAGGEEDIDKTISKIYRDNRKLENNFPVLVKRLEPKKNMD